jgi:hypothetical protein
VGIAQTLPTSSPLRDVLLYAAPTASVVTGALAYYLEMLMTRLLQERLVKGIRKRLEDYLANPHTSMEHKQKLRQQMEELEEAMVLQEIETVKLIGRTFQGSQ